MQAKQLSIKAKRIVVRGVKQWEITGISGYDVLDIPEQYLAEFPFCYMTGDELILVTNDKTFEQETIIGVGHIFSPEQFDKFIKIIQVCGDKLHNINKMIKTIKQEWHGEEEFKI
jgi:hypothetical protein